MNAAQQWKLKSKGSLFAAKICHSKTKWTEWEVDFPGIYCKNLSKKEMQSPENYNG